MNNILTALTVLICTSAGLHAQTQEYLYNKHWQRTSKKKEYAYKRSVKQIGQTTFQVTDYYYGVGKYMKGIYLTTHPEYLADYRSTLYRHDTFVYYHPNGAIKSKGKFLRGYQHGEWLEFHADGTTVAMRGTFNHGKANGKFEQFDSQGKLLMAMEFDEGKLDGKNEAYGGAELLRLGQPMAKDFKEVTGKGNSMNYIEQMPEPDYNINEFLARKIHYPPEAKAMRIKGKAYIKLVVDTSGHIVDVEPYSPEVDELLMLEALRVVGMMPPWKPGMQNGKPVKVYYTLPINFKLE